MGALAALSLLLLAACQAPTGRQAGEPDSMAQPASPSWLNEPLSWDKLDQIERWLAHSAASQDRGMALEARLQLSEGRLEFTRRDLERGGSLQAPARARVETARVELQSVERDSHATPGQRTRARLGLESCTRLLSRTPLPQVDSQALQVLPRSTWRARPARTGDMTPLRGNWTRITVHHSAETADAPGGSNMGDTIATLQRIQKVHMDQGDPSHGWADIGYHFLIDDQGRVFEGRGLGWQGAHARGANNIQNIGICLLGDYSGRAPTPAEMNALAQLVLGLRERYGIPASRVLAHSELSATACPGPSLLSWVKQYRRSSGPRP